jgi:hypothetical protein
VIPSKQNLEFPKMKTQIRLDTFATLSFVVVPLDKGAAPQNQRDTLDLPGPTALPPQPLSNAV